MTDWKSAKLWRAARAVLAIGVFALAMPAAAMEMSAQKGDNGSVEVTGAKTDLVFAAAHNVHVQATSNDDMFLAGHDVKLDAGSADHAFVAGETITVNGDNARAFLAAGHDVNFETGSAASDVIAFGNDVSTASTFKIGGSAVIMGESVHIQSPIGRDLTAAGSTVTIDSAVTGNVRAEGRHIIVGPNAKIGGDFSYRAGDKIDISPTAVITGKKILLPADETHFHWTHNNKWKAAGAGAMGGWHHRLMHDFLGALGFIVLCLVMTAVFPLLMARTGGMLTRNPLMAGLVGLIVLIIGPILTLIVLITIIGASLALTMFALIWAAMLMGFVGAAAGVASLVGRFKDTAPNIGAHLGWTIAGAVILSLLGALPYVGFWVWFVACVLGTGAVAAQGRSLWAKA
ncbi:MAG TPA: hypothetical protein VGL66_06900 [Caulobacteraceae bacterium]|jgi:hypothetical protein